MRPLVTPGLVLAVLLASLAAEAQDAGKVYRVGVLETTPIALNAANLNAFRLGLKELGYVEGRNVVIEYRSADGRPAMLYSSLTWPPGIGFPRSTSRGSSWMLGGSWPTA